MERREEIKEILKKSNTPISASKIASVLGVSRQVIVGDIALLRASGFNVLATPRGYILETVNSVNTEYNIVCQHNNAQLRDEIYTVIDLGGSLLDVTVEHTIYGQISAPLHIFSRFDADAFLNKIQKSDSKPLCNLTDGLHLHRISCPNGECFERICDALRQKGILYEV